MKTITLHNFKHTLRDIHTKTESRKLCFVLGAGASYKSGIPTGGHLSGKWFDEIKERYSEEELKQWMENVKINEADLASHYGSIYRKRFENDKTSGYEFLVQEMKNAKPTFGHFVLAQILTKTSGNCVLTTNFDSLIESSIYQYTDKTPLVCGHESLSGYARPSGIHPLIIKIHRDLLLSPKNDPDEISKLDDGWKEPLDNIFSSHIPIVIGYGGNDGSLMDYFENMNKPSNFFWFGLEGNLPSSRVEKLIDKFDGHYIEITGFEEMMQDLLWVFDEIKPIKEELDGITKSRIEAMNKQLKEINAPVELNASLAKVYAPEAILKKELSAFEYAQLAEDEPDYEKRKTIYLEALEKFPKTGWLWSELTYFLHFIKKEYSNLEEYYLKALSIEPENASNNGNYAIFLNDIKKDYKNAEKYYLKALSIEPEHASNNGNYAIFLNDIKKDHENAEKYYLKALSIEPENASNNGNYAIFLNEIKKDCENAEKYYLKALAIEPENTSHNGNYAIFLNDIKKDYVNAEKYYLKALSIEPEHESSNGNYAIFLHATKKDHINAEKYYLKALSIEPADARNNGNYAIFLNEIKKEYENAEKYYLKALSIDPEHINNNGNYANFLKNIKEDYENAEKHFLKALSVDPEDANTNRSYAHFLSAVKNDYINSDKHYIQSLYTEPEDANTNGNYACLLLITNRMSEATKFWELAFEFNKNEKNGLLLELWFYKYAHYTESIAESENIMEELLQEGIRSIGWNFDLNIATAIKNGHPNAEKLKEFAERITKAEHLN